MVGKHLLLLIPDLAGEFGQVVSCMMTKQFLIGDRFIPDELNVLSFSFHVMVIIDMFVLSSKQPVRQTANVVFSSGLFTIE